MRPLRFALLLTLAGATPLLGQVKSTLITEASYSARLAGGTDNINSFDGPSWINFMAAIGTVKPVTPKFDIGGVATVGVWDDFYVAVGPRLRFHPSPTVTMDVTPQLILKRGNADAGRGMIDAAVMYKDQIGISVQLGSFTRYVYGPDYPNDFVVDVQRKPALFVGLRLGGKPGRYGILADGVTLATLMTWLVIVCSGGGCD